MAYKLLVTQKAEDDLDNIIGYITGKLCNTEAAGALLDEIEGHYDALEDNPYLYALCAQPLLRRGEYRKIAINGYLLFYRMDEARKLVYVERFFSELQDYADKL